MADTLKSPSGRSPEWPDDFLDVAALHNGGWHPSPFRQFLFKVHSRCNLSCDYCYVYEMADQSWRSRPLTMSAEVAAQASARIAEHILTHSLDEVLVILHGGEPLMAGPGFFADFTTMVRKAAPADCAIEFGVQTNAVLLDESFLDVLWRHRIHVGVSLDGGRDANDRHRSFANGRGSYDTVATALRRLSAPPYNSLYTGLLCTIDLDNDPVATYEALLEFSPPAIDFLLPHGNWSQPPPGRHSSEASTPYADWLIQIFDRWYATAGQETGVRFFEEIMNLVSGGHSRLESIGLTPGTLVVIEADGTLEQVDSLKAAYPGAPAIRAECLRQLVRRCARLPAIAARQIGVRGLCEKCRQCAVRDICGGGSVPIDTGPGTAFSTPRFTVLTCSR